jgi:hypothetical protein
VRSTDPGSHSKAGGLFQRLGGIYTLVTVGADGVFRSHVLEGLWLRVDWLWQEPLLPLMSILKQWGLVR